MASHLVKNESTDPILVYPLNDNNCQQLEDNSVELPGNENRNRWILGDAIYQGKLFFTMKGRLNRFLIFKFFFY